MSKQADQTPLLLFELAMSIGNSLDLRSMLKECLSTYLRKLNCSAGGILRYQDRGGLTYLEPVYTVPRNVQKSGIYAAFAGEFPNCLTEEELNIYRQHLPSRSSKDNKYLHVMELPGFGVVFMLKNDCDLDPYMAQSLLPLNTKLANACQACLQKDKLSRSEKKYRQIFDRFPDLYYQTDLEGNITNVSPSILAIFGFEREEILGKNIRFLYKDPTERQTFLEQILDTGSVNNFELRMINAEGETRHVLINSQVRYDGDCTPIGIDGVIRDITERRRTAKALEKTNQRLQDIIFSSHDWIWEVDTEGRYTYVSDSVKSLLGYEPSDVLGRHCFDLMVPEDADRVREFFKTEAITKSRLEDLENWLITKDGRKLCMLTNGFPMIQEGVLTGYRGVDKDITLWKNAEQQLLLAKEKAEHTSRLKSQFLANMSHEIRTPINAIIGLTQFLLDEMLTEPQKQYVHTIHESSQNLLQIINDILDFSKIEAGSLNLDKVDTSLSGLLSGIRSLFEKEAKSKGLAFQMMSHGTLPEIVRIDPLRLRQCLINLLGNAIKFTSEGFVTVHVSYQEMDGQHQLQFDVEDSGIGIAAEKQKDIFDAFTQADGSTTRQFGGTGLGLAITQNLVHLMGGGMALNSQVGEGSVFSLTIPIEDCTFTDPEPAGQDLVTQAKPSQFKALSGHVLVAEDDRLNQVVVKGMLKKMGLTCTVVENGQQALDQLEHADFDLVLMDIQMPIMNGYEATEQIRHQYGAIPIIALTAHAMKEDRDQCFRVGCDAYLTKPISKDKLYKTLQPFLKTPANTAF